METETFNDQIEVPLDNFIQDYNIALNMVDSMISTYSSYWELIKACQRHIQGEKPVPYQELKAKGMSWVWNYNFGKARAKIEKGTAESIARLSSAVSLGYVTFRDFEEEDRDDPVLRILEDPNIRGIAAAMVGYSMVSVLSKETRLSSWLNDIEYPSYAFGYCPVIFNDFDWMPEPIHPLNIAFEPNTKPEEIQTWVTFGEMKAKDIYLRWAAARNEKMNKEDERGNDAYYAQSGWNPKALEEILVRLYREKVNGKSVDNFDQILPLYRANARGVISCTDSLQIAKIKTVELNGNLSEVYIPYSNPWQKENEGTQKDNPYSGHIIYKKDLGKYDQKKNILLIRDSGFSETGFIEDLRGIAKYSVEDSIRYNRVRNNMGNKSIFMGAPTFIAPNGQVKQNFKCSVMAPFVIYDANFQPVEKQPSYDVGSHMNILRFEEGEYLRDTQQYDATIQGRLTSRPNRGEVEQVTREVEFTNNAKNTIKFRDYSAVFQSVLLRMPGLSLIEGTDIGFEGKKKFYKAIKKNLSEYIKTDSDVDKLLGAIDSYIIEPILNNTQTIMFAIQQAETPFARNRFKRMLMLAQGFPIEEVNMAVPLITDKFTNFQDERLALMENDMFWTTNEVLAQGTDDQIIHIESHLAKGNQVSQGFQEQRLQPKDVAAFISNMMQHVMVHIEILGEDPVLNGRAQDYIPAIRQLDQIRQQAVQAARQQVEQEAAQEQQVTIDPKTQNEIASKNAKTLADTQRKDWLAQDRAQKREIEIENKHEQKMRELELKYSTPNA